VTLNRLTAISLTLLFLFNLIGYKAFFFYAQERSDRQYEAILNTAHFDESNMITLKVDLNMPYLAENTLFERVDGEITIDGHIYKYVKRRICNGQLVLLCLPDAQKTKLQSARQEFFAYANNLAASGHSSTPKIQQTVPADYDQNRLEFIVSHFIAFIKHDLPKDQPMNLSPITDLPERPPQFA
jgi:hypothetical protein